MEYFAAIMIGLTIVVSMTQNSRLEKDIDIKQVTLLNFITGSIGTLILFIIGGHELKDFIPLTTMPWYGYIGGVLGVVSVTLCTITMKHLSVITASMLMYTGQMFIGIVIDVLRGIDFSIGRIIGCVLIVLGVYFNSYMDTIGEKENALQN